MNKVHRVSVDSENPTGKVFKVHNKRQSSPSTGNLKFSEVQTTFNLLAEQEFSNHDNITFEELKIRMTQFLKMYLQRKFGFENIHEELINTLKNMENVQKIFTLFELSFGLVFNLTEKKYDYGLQYKHSAGSINLQKKGAKIQLKSKDYISLRIIKPEDNVGKNGLDYKELISKLEQANNQLKKQVYSLRQEQSNMQKRVLRALESQKKNKTFYENEIRRLITIVNMSSLDIRRLILQKEQFSKTQNAKRQQKRLENFSFEGQERKGHQQARESPFNNYVTNTFNGYNYQIRAKNEPAKTTSHLDVFNDSFENYRM